MMRALIAFCLLTSLASAQLYTLGTQGDDNIREIDPTNAMTLNTIAVVGASGNGFNAMAQDPVTDDVYVLQGGNFNAATREFGSLDIATGQYTAIGNTGHSLNSLAFDTCGNLFALDGQRGNWGDIYSIDKATGGATFLLNVPLSGLGSALMFDPATGMLLLYADCPSSNGVLIDPVTLAVTPLGMFPMTGTEIQGGAPSAAGDIFVTDFSDLFRITSAGGSTLVGSLDHSQRGIVEFANQVNLPGTGEDLVNGYQLGFGAQQFPLNANNDILTIVPGDSLTVFHFSPGGTFAYTGELLSIGSFLVPGAKPPFLFPGLQINPSGAFLVDTAVGPFPGQLPAAGFLFSFTYGGGALAGLDIAFQGIVISGAAANSVFASTNALRVELR